MKREMKHLVYSIVILMSFVMLVACNQQTTKNVDTEISSESLQTDITEDDSTAVSIGSGEEHWNTDNTTYTVAVRVTINPDAILYLQEQEVVGVSFLNDDAKNTYSTEWMLGRTYQDVLYDMMKEAEQGGFIKEDTKISVEILDQKSAEESTDYVYDCPIQAFELVEEETGVRASLSLDGMSSEEWTEHRDVDNTSSETPAENVNSQPENNNSNSDNPPSSTTCTDCNGRGDVTCSVCGGNGNVIEIVEYEEWVRNDYVCPTCGGKGWIDDGMHGGETAECGYCTTGGGSAPFREKAYDRVIVEEEVSVSCSECGGSGNVTCARCGGSGEIK